MAEIIAVASGKGGVGKSFFSANLAMSMKKLDDAILLVDGDLGGANLHSFVGLKAQGKGIYNFLKENFRIEDVILQTPAQVDFIGGSSDILGMAHINNFEKLKILNHLKRANYRYVVMDLGAGTSYNMIDFFNFSDKKVLIMNSEPTSIENSYGFLKIALYRKIERHLFKDPRLENICSKLRSRSMNYQRVDDILEELDRIDSKISEDVLEIVSGYKVGLVLNMLKFKKELNIFYGFENVSKKYLRISVEKLGFLPYDLYVSESLKKLEPYYFNTTDSNREFFDEIRDIILKKL
ncbi:MAG: P-loop NTPase [Calditerrivibrio sp.]|jgi:flagellar biosynthesis protein FlhG|uniref:P-loop NTPase n=1 Tax=Calditerrivibrio sp. TaxID=2792612 RepID=UPI003D13672D